MKVVALAGGVGGAKLAHGLAGNLLPSELTIVVNTADDFEHLGLRISPDLDTVCYTLAGIGHPGRGWGLAKETWNAVATLRQLGGPAWFHLGDRDLGTHLERTRLLRAGWPLSRIVKEFCKAWGVAHNVLPMTDDRVATIVHTDEGELEFQEYFVHRSCRPRVRAFNFRGVEEAAPAPGVTDALEAAEAIIICPSNPWVSIGPILAVPGIRSRVQARTTVAVSPIVGGRALRGPAAKMFAELGFSPSASAVAEHYHHLVAGFVLDQRDSKLDADVRALNIRTLVCDTIMRSVQDRRRLARRVLDFLQTDWS
jgi:LPPG:FO 2-phospho-L-lactate transferase